MTTTDPRGLALGVQPQTNLRKILLDEKNTDIIELCDHLGKSHLFRQLAVVPRDDDIYCILKPLDDIGLNACEAVVFKLMELEKDVHLLVSESDEKISMQIFLVYYELLSQAISSSNQPKEHIDARLEMINSIVKEYRTML